MATATEAKTEGKTRTVVINNREGLVMAQMPHGSKDKSGFRQLGAAISFIPGVNLVPTDVLETLRENEAFNRQFTTKIEASAAPEQNPEKVGKFILEVDKSIGKDGRLPDGYPLAGLPFQQCASLISENFSSAMLGEWLKEEGRAEVRRDIANQLEKLRTGVTSAGPAAAGR